MTPRERLRRTIQENPVAVFFVVSIAAILLLAAIGAFA